MQKFILGSPEDGLCPMPLGIGVTATPLRFDNLVSGSTASTIQKVQVPPEDVRESGLLKDRIIIHFPTIALGADMTMLQSAIENWMQKCRHWEQYCARQDEANVDPVLVIQVEDGSSREATSTDLSNCIDMIQQARIENIIKNFSVSPRIVDLTAWADTHMINKFRRLFNGYVTDAQLAALSGTYRFLEPDDFAKEMSDTRCSAFNNGVESVMNLDYPDDILKSNIAHESLHQISDKSTYYDNASGLYVSKGGLQIDTRPSIGRSWTSKYVGINETVTEYLTELSLGNDYPSGMHCGYQPAVRRLKQILNMNIEGLDSEVIKRAYIDSDISPIATAIDKVVSPNFFENELIPAFDEAIEGNLFELDKIIIKLKFLVNKRR